MTGPIPEAGNFEAGPFARGTFAPDPGSGSRMAMLWGQARLEARLALRNGEQVLLTLLLPLAAMIGLTLIHGIPLGPGTPGAAGGTGRAGAAVGADSVTRIDVLAPRIFALAIMSSAFTSQAISLGFDRRYGVLRRLTATAVPRWLIVAGRALAALLVVAVQLLLLGATAVLLGWRPDPPALPGLLLLALTGTAAFGALGALLGGALRAEIVLAVANLLWFALVLAGGLVFMLGEPGSSWHTVVELLPSGALAMGLGEVTLTGPGLEVMPVLVLLAWTALAGVLAARTLRLR